MSEYDIPIVRIVVNGKPSLKNAPDNIERASNMLHAAFTSREWPGKALFAVTPGGFIRGKIPKAWHGEKGWKSRNVDFESLVEHATPLVNEVLKARVLRVARPRARYLTLGIDLLREPDIWKLRRKGMGVHIELVCVVDLQTGNPIHWTGKSYPTQYQENWLVQVVNLESHLFRCSRNRVLILGCHDLNMFSERSKSLAVRGSQKYKRISRMRKLATEFRPTIVLQHPHSTDSPRIWQTAWSGVRNLLANNAGALRYWASGIAYFNGHVKGKKRAKLPDVLAGTRSSEEHVKDVIVRP